MQQIKLYQNGRNFIDASFYHDFRDILGITINELLAGEHLNTQDNQYCYEMNLHNRINSYNNINRKNKIIIFMIFSTLIF